MILFLLITEFAVGQKPSKSDGAIIVNKEWYVAGDTVWFKVFLPLTFDYQNSILKASLYDHQQDLIVQDFHLKVTNGGQSQGFFTIPHTTKTASNLILIQVYHEESHNEHTLIKHQILIFNDQMDLANIDDILVTETLSNWPNDLVANIRTPQKFYNRRQQIVLEIETKDMNGNPISADLSLSVAQVQNGVINQQVAKVYDIEDNSDSDSIVVEDNIIVTGIITDLDTQQPIDRSFFSAFLEQEGTAFSLNTDRNGKFTVELAPEEGSYNVQFFDPFSRNILVDVDAPQVPDINPKQLKTIIDPGELHEALQRSSQRKKWDYLFDSFQEPPAADTVVDWNHKPDYSIRTSDYEPFSSFQEAMQTLITPLKLRKSENGLVAKMVNPLNKPFFPESPVFIMDRKITPFEKVIEYNMKNVIKFDFFNTPETLEGFEQMGANGVVIIHTWLPEPYDQTITVNVHGVQRDVSYPVEVDADKGQRTPMLDPAVYWNPLIHTGENGQTSVSFHHHDGIGQFKLTLFGRGINGGWCQSSLTYEVQP